MFHIRLATPLAMMVHHKDVHVLHHVYGAGMRRGRCGRKMMREGKMTSYLPHTFILGQVCVHASSAACGKSGEEAEERQHGSGEEAEERQHGSGEEAVTHSHSNPTMGG